jgi:hypothetical protein
MYDVVVLRFRMHVESIIKEASGGLVPQGSATATLGLH